jgi:flagellar biosynthesis protein FlhF
VKSDYTFLTVSAATSPASLTRYAREFSKIGANSIVLTKMDEAERIGAIIEPIASSGLPLMYLTNGQRIPEDLEPATRSKIADILFSENVEI